MKNKILGAALTPIVTPLILVQLHYAGKPSKFEKDQAKRRKKIEQFKANRHR